MFLYQKKAEEAHRILEGLGPRVELVSGDFHFMLCFCSCIYFHSHCFVFDISGTWEHFTDHEVGGRKDSRERQGPSLNVMMSSAAA